MASVLALWNVGDCQCQPHILPPQLALYCWAEPCWPSCASERRGSGATAFTTKQRVSKARGLGLERSKDATDGVGTIHEAGFAVLQTAVDQHAACNLRRAKEYL